MNEDFLGGVIEGFYGQPWSHAQRIQLFDWMVEWGLNTYLYAPKDDLKHRAIWREPYTESELALLSELTSACRQRSLRFVYGLSPGLDIRFSDDNEIQAIQTRFEQLMRIGVEHFALLFDDIPGELSNEDQGRFPSFATAQAGVANDVFQWLCLHSTNSRMLFCPTPYCGRMDRSNLGGEAYLDTIGRELSQDIDILWTGPEIISEDITAESIGQLAERIRRKPVIWDNLHANDYDLRRLYCGPYSRSPELRGAVKGILANPNNEFPVNYVPLRTLGAYLAGGDYEPRGAFLNAASEWSHQFQTVDSQISSDDIVLLADCYYLPHSEGETAERLVQLVAILVDEVAGDWNGADAEFAGIQRRIERIFRMLTELQDRELFYAWSRRIWELREELDLLKQFVDQKKSGLDPPFSSPTHLPSTYRGGIVASLQKYLAMDADGSFRSR